MIDSFTVARLRNSNMIIRKKTVNLAVLHKLNQLDEEKVEIALKNQ